MIQGYADCRTPSNQHIDVGGLPGRHLAAGFDAKRRRGQRRDHPTGHWIQRSRANRGSSPAFCAAATAVARCTWPTVARRVAIIAKARS